MARLHILEVRDGIPGFREVEGEAVDIGEGIQAFFMRPPSGEWGVMYDVITGARLTEVHDTEWEAQEAAESWLAENGLLRWHDSQMAYVVKYDRPSETEIEIIQEPRAPGELEVCNRETHCGHH